MQKEIPIIFTTEMVEGILAGRKTMTRRIVAKANSCYSIRWDDINWNDVYKNSSFGLKVGNKSDGTIWRVSAKWQPDDILWVRESWQWVDGSLGSGCYVFRAGKEEDQLGVKKWKPSIHMPKESARIWLRVAGVKGERLHEISDNDAIDEGIEYVVTNMIRGYRDYSDKPREIIESIVDTPKQAYQTLWEKINGAKSWEANPWVWALSFEVLSTTGKSEIHENRVGEDFQG